MSDMTILLALYNHVLLETSQQSLLCENDIVVTWEESWIMYFCPKKNTILYLDIGSCANVR